MTVPDEDKRWGGWGRRTRLPLGLIHSSTIHRNGFWRDSSSGERMVSSVQDGVCLMCLWDIQGVTAEWAVGGWGSSLASG